MTVTLSKESDNSPALKAEFAFLYSPVWLNTVRLAMTLDKIFPPDRSDAIYSGLADNDLRIFRYFLRKQANSQERY